MDCQEFEELSGAYTLGAVTPEEQQDGDEHIEQCSRCRITYQKLKKVRDLLPLSVPTIRHSELAGKHMLARIRAIEAQKIDARWDRQPAQARGRKSSRGSWLLALAAVLVISLLGGMMTWNIFLQQQIASLSMFPGPVMVYSIKSTDGTPGISGEVIFFPKQHRTTLIMHGLSPLNSAHVYQGWLIQNNRPESIGLLTVHDGIATRSFSGDVTSYETAAVSVEQGPEGSQKGPLGPVVAAGWLKNPLHAQNSVKSSPLWLSTNNEITTTDRKPVTYQLKEEE